MSVSGLTRRRAARLLVDTLTVRAASSAVGAFAAQIGSIPAGPCTLVRRLSRGLRDGRSIVVTRNWRILFAEQSRGFAVSGEQMSVSVEAPAKLAPLADIERKRSTDGMFPILLAPDRTIVAAGPNTSQTSFKKALNTAKALLAQNGLSEEDVEQQAVYMANLQKAGSTLLEELPGDLFFPSTKPFRSVQELTLPNGLTGVFELIWKASAHEDTGLLQSARREVITRIGETERRSREEWSLTEG